MIRYLLLLFILLTPTPSSAAPFLVCDPYTPEDNIIGFAGTLDGKPFQTKITLHSSGAPIIFDLGQLDDGPHKFEAIMAVNSRGPSSPVPFSLPKKAASTSNIRILP